MKRTLALTLLLSSTLMAEESSKQRALRRIFATSSCAMSAVDGWQSTHFPTGVREANPLGVPAVLALKGIGCAGTWYIGERTQHKKLALWYGVVMTGLFSGVVAHNQITTNR